jgi:hypothetical protein
MQQQQYPTAIKVAKYMRYVIAQGNPKDSAALNHAQQEIDPKALPIMSILYAKPPQEKQNQFAHIVVKVKEATENHSLMNGMIHLEGEAFDAVESLRLSELPIWVKFSILSHFHHDSGSTNP